MDNLGIHGGPREKKMELVTSFINYELITAQNGKKKHL